MLEYALSLARDLAHSWPRGPHQYYLCATPPSSYHQRFLRLLERLSRSSLSMPVELHYYLPYYFNLVVLQTTSISPPLSTFVLEIIHFDHLFGLSVLLAPFAYDGFSHLF
jgi:hypothetical protein